MQCHGRLLWIEQAVVAFYREWHYGRCGRCSGEVHQCQQCCHVLLEMAGVGCLSASIFKPVMNILKFQLSVWPAPTPPPSSVEKQPTVSLSFFESFEMISRLRLTVMTYLLSFIRLLGLRPARRISKRRWNATLPKMPKSICRGNN